MNQGFLGSVLDYVLYITFLFLLFVLMLLLFYIPLGLLEFADPSDIRGVF